MKALSVGPDRPVDPITIEVLRAVDAAATALAIPYFVAGAMARDIIMLNVFGFDTIRATRDLDLAVHVAGWDQFAALKKRLIDCNRFSPVSGSEQKLHYDSTYPVDLIPFGGVVESDGNINWPPDQAIVMNASGYEEALGAMLRIEVEAGLLIPVASLASLAMLKVFGWLGRGHIDRRDALDLALLLRRYAEMLDQDDLYAAEIAVLEAVDYDLERAGARLLGRHVRRITAPRTIGELLRHLQHEPTRHRLTIDMAQALRQSEDPVERASRFLGDFIEELSQDPAPDQGD